MNDFELSYREVIPDQTNAQIRKDITINTGAAQSTLQDIKVIEKAGGYCYSDLSHESKRNRFIYWRTNGDVLELSEISLDLNLTDNAVRYKFTDAPILAVSIAESNDHIIVLVATVSSLHQLKFSQPREFQKIHDETQSYSVFHGVCTGQTVRDANTSLVYVINQLSASNQPIPHTASCALSENGREAYFALAYQSNMILYTMNCLNGQVGFVELKESYRILTNLTGAFRGKNPDSQYVTSMVFGTCKFGAIDDTVFLYGLYRDDHMRMWSVKTGQCVSIVNCVPNALETRTRGSRNNLLRKAAPDMLCAFLCSAKGSEFVTIRVSSDGTSIVLQQISVIPSPEFDLIEFDVNYKRIWGLWCNSQGEYNVSSYSLVSNGDYSWSSAGLEILPERKIEPGSDPRQAYCSYIFYPGRFQREVIDRALVMFRRSNVLSDPNVPLTALKDRVCYAVEQEVQNELKEFDVTDDVYIETSFKAWERFYSCCEQYHIKATQPIGLVNLDSIGAVTVIKKNAFSLLRPCELLEHLMLLGENVECLTGLGLDDENITEDLIKLITTLSTLEQNISDESKAEIDTKLYELNTPNELISQLLSDYEHNFIDPELRDSINSEMKFISQLPNAMTMLLKLLQMNDAETDDMQTSFPNILHTSRGLLSIGHLFRSDTGISLVSESLHQIAVIRYALCRNLLILQQILIDSSDLPIDTLEYIRSDCMPETVVFVQAYYVMVWICETSETPPTTGNLDASIQKLSTLQLSDCRYKSRPNHPTTLLEQFLRGKGLEAGVWMLLQDQCRDINDIQWKNTLLPLATIVGQLLWAVDGNFIFGEWLIGSCQHILIQEYVRLLNSWCEWNKYSRHFIAAVSLLDDGEPYKAFDLFMQCAKGVQQEAFLVKVILQSAEDLTQSESVTQYYLRVIQLFEQYSSQDCVISLAKAAIDELDPSSPQLAMFQSIVFANHLSLEHYEEAYHSLIANTEPSRRKDCLRQLVVCLFEKQRLDLLMKFPYLGLQEELEAIIESRARSMAIENNIYYDFLYAFYISKSTMRKAASVMYEQALRCQLETKTLSGLEHRYECLLACVTALSLADEDYRWIARPVISDEIPDEHDENDMETDEVATKQKVVVCELAEIRKELLLTDAIITLAKHRKELSTIVNATPDDVIAVLSNAGLYTDAVKLAVKFEKSIANILQGLAFACVRANDESSNDSWAWLQENDLADIPQKNSPSDMAWKLLQRLIHDYEEDGLTTLHKAVTNKLLALGEFLPHWLFLSYREKNASELLNLYVTHGRLVEATSLAKEYIAAMTNTGSEYFGLKNCMQSTLPPLCFPVNTIDSLLHNLKLNSEEDVEYAQCHNELSDVVNNYLSTAERISIDKIQYLAANATR